jgi:hypothetical protein
MWDVIRILAGTLLLLLALIAYMALGVLLIGGFAKWRFVGGLYCLVSPPVPVGLAAYALFGTVTLLLGRKLLDSRE